MLEANQTRELVRIAMADRYRDASYRVQAAAVPGDPRTTPEPVAYQLPLASGTRYGISQAFGGSFSHTDEQNYHAVDLGVAEGTPVLAARDGVVVQVERDFFEAAPTASPLPAPTMSASYTDGTMAVCAPPRIGARAAWRDRPGWEHIGDAGATGFATGPHPLRRVRNAGMRLCPSRSASTAPTAPGSPAPAAAGNAFPDRPPVWPRPAWFSRAGRRRCAGQGARDAAHPGQFDAGGGNALPAAELLEQGAAPARADAGNVFQPAGLPGPLAPSAVAGDGEAVRLVADLLDQLQRR